MAKADSQEKDGDGLREKMISVNRVTKVVKGGRILGFAALTVVGVLAAGHECRGREPECDQQHGLESDGHLGSSGRVYRPDLHGRGGRAAGDFVG